MCWRRVNIITAPWLLISGLLALADSLRPDSEDAEDTYFPRKDFLRRSFPFYFWLVCFEQLKCLNSMVGEHFSCSVSSSLSRAEPNIQNGGIVRVPRLS